MRRFFKVRLLGVSESRLKDFEDAYELALQAGVARDNASIRNADFVKKKLERLNRIQAGTKFENISKNTIAPSSAWEPNSSVPTNMFEDVTH